jgi:hypothetical protein
LCVFIEIIGEKKRKKEGRMEGIRIKNRRADLEEASLENTNAKIPRPIKRTQKKRLENLFS